MTRADDGHVRTLRVARNLAEFFVGGARDSGQRYLEGGVIHASDRLLQDAMANSAVVTVPDAPSRMRSAVAEAAAFYAETDSPWLVWCAWPDLDLEFSGLQAVGEPPLMLRTAVSNLSVMPDGLTVREVTTPDALVKFDQTFRVAYPVQDAYSPDRPLFGAGMIGGSTRFWNGYVDGVCVCVASACVFADVVTVNAVATLESYRGRGFAAAITDIAARCQPELPVLLLASDAGRPVYERLGFRAIGSFRLWYGPRASEL